MSGTVRSVKFPLDELHGHGGYADIGQSVLQIVCRVGHYDILCPPGGTAFVDSSVVSSWHNEYERVETESDNVRCTHPAQGATTALYPCRFRARGRVSAPVPRYYSLPLRFQFCSSPPSSPLPQKFRMPNIPGLAAPPVESLLLLKIAHDAWLVFGRWLLLIEFSLYAPFLALVTWVTVDRARDGALLMALDAKGEGVAADVALIVLALLTLSIQYFKYRRDDFIRYWLTHLYELSRLEVTFLICVCGTCGLAIAAAAVRLKLRSEAITEAVVPASDIELLSVACILGWFDVLYFVRCFTPFGPLTIVVIQARHEQPRVPPLPLPLPPSPLRSLPLSSLALPTPCSQRRKRPSPSPPPSTLPHHSPPSILPPVFILLSPADARDRCDEDPRHLRLRARRIRARIPRDPLRDRLRGAPETRFVETRFVHDAARLIRQRAALRARSRTRAQPRTAASECSAQLSSVQLTSFFRLARAQFSDASCDPTDEAHTKAARFSTLGKSLLTTGARSTAWMGWVDGCMQ